MKGFLTALIVFGLAISAKADELLKFKGVGFDNSECTVQLKISGKQVTGFFVEGEVQTWEVLKDNGDEGYGPGKSKGREQFDFLSDMFEKYGFEQSEALFSKATVLKATVEVSDTVLSGTLKLRIYGPVAAPESVTVVNNFRAARVFKIASAKVECSDLTKISN